MTYFNHARDFTINGGTFTSGGLIGIEKLVKASNSRAMHNSSARYDPPKCHPGTRLIIMKHIMQWILGSDDRETVIIWLYGPAGAGKSAILQSIAEKCAAINVLLATFFFSRADSTRDHPGSLVATIASQISTRIPDITALLDAAIVQDPMIFDKTLNAQIDALIVGPLRSLAQSGFFSDTKSSPRIIIIDGLDECSNETHRRAVLHAIAYAIRVHNIPLIFLISSRPETDIKFSFNSAELVSLWSSMVLDNLYQANGDIRLYLNDSFQSIKETHPMKRHIPRNIAWPSPSALNTLVRKSSGQFIYASTVIKYISAIRASPSQRLDTVLGVRPARSGDLPFAEIDALYMHILSTVSDTELMLDILALLMGYFDFAGIYSASNLSWFLNVDQSDVDIIFSSLASLITLDDDTLFCVTSRLSHASLGDFLSDKKRSQSLHIDRAQYSARFCHKGIKWICANKRVNLNMFETVFTSHRPSQMTEELYHDLESLPLELIWKESQRMIGKWYLDSHWLNMFKWLLPESKFLPAETATYTDLKYQELCVKYTERLKKLVNVKERCSIDIRIKHFNALAETLPHNFVLLGKRYDEEITALLQEVVHPQYPYSIEGLAKDVWPYALFSIIGLSHINSGQDPYTHSALRIFKSLASQHDVFRFQVSSPHDCHCYYNPCRFKPVNPPQTLVKPIFQRKPKCTSSKRISIYRIPREIRLMKSRMKICTQYRLSFGRNYNWRRKLISQLFIPILDQCPQSDTLLALINRRMNHVVLKYTLRRRLKDAVGRYIARTSGVGSN